MQKLSPKDLWPNQIYERARDEYRARIIAIKKPRRVELGDCVTLIFENRETVKFQIQEMLRAEGITSPPGIQAELDVYNDLVPADGELAATLMIDVTEEAQIPIMLNRLLGLEEQLYLLVDAHEVKARFEEGRSDGARVSAVQFVRFPFTAAWSERFLAAPSARLELRHPSYRAAAVLEGESLASLKRDLRG